MGSRQSATELLEVKASGVFSSPGSVIALVERSSQAICDEVILTPIFLLDNILYTFWGELGSGSRCFLSAWSEMLRNASSACEGTWGTAPM